MSKKIAVLGAGSWGSILASVLVQNGNEVVLWTIDEEQVKELNEKHTNEHYIHDYTYPEELKTTLDLKEAVDGADFILFAIPTKVIRSVAQQVVEVLKQLDIKPILIHASKGLELGTHKRLSQVITEEIPEQYRSGMVVFSGPSHAEEVANKDITLITAACEDIECARAVQDIFMNNYLRIYTNTDVVGVEVGGAFKNIIAIGAGILHGLNYGDDAKAALMTRGLAEISRLGVAMGADPATFMGLSGVGDLIVTCTSVHSRNWRCGNQLGQGKKLDDIIENMGMVIEGINTCKAAYEVGNQLNLCLPICSAMYNVLYNGANIPEEIEKLMERPGKSEIENYGHKE
ncbi:NAD(P)H-dependent glycerol-3-phosphate dehydrogenase [Ligilactobacillus cholophilus]|uniref:NAD(P)H-dependent glycerol-3-phosphate dehydrogenase n=1 Tax=Ligilactobacillus cholophilus TaxID=3050131 RepID=UPI0025AED5F0|nr:NAD(P)H-dependent glycerol-3-phosphate dehydrogenase [Ligilactobacillus cholophilus]